MQKVGEKGKLFSRDEVAVLERGLVTNPENLYMPRVKRMPPIMLALQSVALLEPYIPEEERNRPKMERILYMFEPDSLVCRGDIFCPLYLICDVQRSIFIILTFVMLSSIQMVRTAGMVRWHRSRVHFSKLLFSHHRTSVPVFGQESFGSILHHGHPQPNFYVRLFRGIRGSGFESGTSLDRRCIPQIGLEHYRYCCVVVCLARARRKYGKGRHSEGLAHGQGDETLEIFEAE